MNSVHTAGEWAAGYEQLRDDDAELLYQHAPVGYMTVAPDGIIVKVNETFLRWTGHLREDLIDRQMFPDLLRSDGADYYETQLIPLLNQHGEVREVALDVRTAGDGTLSVLINATLARYEDGQPRLVRLAVMDATERREYERELVLSRHRAEVAQEQAVNLARTLQDTLLPPALPSIPGLNVAAVYRPAGDGSQVGGDFYDVFQVGPDDWVVMLGDVCGKGVRAAVVTSLVRHTLRAVTVMEADPARVLSTLNAVMLESRDDDRFCTVILIRLTNGPEGWGVAMASGGHAPPLLVRGRHVAPVPFEPGTLIGVFDDATFTSTAFALKPGDTLLLHTDGATEARHESDFFGDERLKKSVRRHEGSPDLVVNGVLADVLTFQDGRASDDIALVAVSVHRD
jgi:sigma-B regulation protein RsbU (phosphoserine phosphatase)